jgi:hypothetical protein
MKISQLRKIIKETIGEMAIDEMSPRPVGTGGGIKISSAGETALKQAKATGQLPEGVKPNHVGILKFLFQAKQNGERVQKADYAVEKFGDPNQPEDAPINREARKQQPRINSLFNELIKLGLIEVDKYVSALGGTTSSTPKKATPSVQDMLGDLDFGDE